MEYEEMNLLELAQEMKDVREQLDSIKAVATGLQKQFDILRLQFIPNKMEEDDIRNITIEGVGRVGVTSDMYVSTLAENRESLRDWMRNHDHGSLVSETINASTLKSWVKNQITEGNEYPSDLIDVKPFTRASITKS